MLFRSLFLDGDGGAGGGGDGGGTGAPAVPTIKVTIDGAEREIPKPKDLFTADELKTKFVPVAAHNDQMARLRREADARKDWKSADDLLEDPEFRTKATEKWGLNPEANKQFQEQLTRQRQELLEREVKPRDTKLAKAGETISKYRERHLFSQIVQAAAGKVNDMYLKPPVKGGQPLIVSMVKDAFDYDEQNDEWFAKGQSGARFAFSQAGDTPYQSVGEFIGNWLTSDGKDFAKSQRQEGAEAGVAGSDPTLSGQVGKELRLTREQIRDIPYFKRMQEKAAKEGLTIVPIP